MWHVGAAGGGPGGQTAFGTSRKKGERVHISTFHFSRRASVQLRTVSGHSHQTMLVLIADRAVLRSVSQCGGRQRWGARLKKGNRGRGGLEEDSEMGSMRWLIVVFVFGLEEFAVGGDFDFDDFAVGFFNLGFVDDGAVFLGFFFDFKDLAAAMLMPDAGCSGTGCSPRRWHEFEGAVLFGFVAGVF